MIRRCELNRLWDHLLHGFQCMLNKKRMRIQMILYQKKIFLVHLIQGGHWHMGSKMFHPLLQIESKVVFCLQHLLG